MENPEAARQVISDLRARGLRVALDDFGTGYSSVAYLNRLSLDMLKIDGTFVRSIGEQNECTQTVRSIIALAQELNLKVIAEGVETREQQDLLIRLGCTHAQGYFFAPPLTAESISEAISPGQPFRLIDRLRADNGQSEVSSNPEIRTESRARK